jgi:diacylglycerol kinase (ATP)
VRRRSIRLLRSHLRRKRVLTLRARSFGFALEGCQSLLVTQANARIHLLATFFVVACGAILGISGIEWALISLAIGIVWMAEALNTAIEMLADELTLDRLPRIKFAKDVAAFGVLAAALAATAVGLLVFVPHILALVWRR